MTEPLRYAAFFGLLGALLAMATVASAPLAVSVPAAWLLVAVEAYLALGLAVVCLAYVLNHYGVPIEETLRPPRRTPWLDGLFLPYRLLAWATVELLRRRDSMALMDPVGDRLFVGRRPLPAD